MEEREEEGRGKWRIARMRLEEKVKHISGGEGRRVEKDEESGRERARGR